MHFGENQLSPGSLGISPLPTAHPYRLQSRSGFGPPRAVPPASPWPWVAHPVSGRSRRDSSPFQTRFRSGSGCPCLNLATPGPLVGSFYKRHAVTRVTPSSDRPEAHGFRFSFTPLAGVLFTVPSRYWFTIGRLRYLALGGGPPRFPPDFTCPAVLTIPGHQRARVRRLRGSHPLRPPVPVVVRLTPRAQRAGQPPPPPGSSNPRDGNAGRLSRRHGLGSSPFARRY